MVYRTTELGDAEEMEFFSSFLCLRVGKLNSVLLVHDKQIMRFIVQYTEVSGLTWRNVLVADMNFISFTVAFTLYNIGPDVNDEWKFQACFFPLL